MTNNIHFSEWNKDITSLKRFVFIIHHLCCLGPLLWVSLNSKLIYLCMFRLTAELSTPFLNIINICDQFESIPKIYGDYAVIAFSIVFIMCRPMVAPIYWYFIYLTDFLEGFEPAGARWSALICSAALDLLTFYWTILIYRRLVRAFSKIRNPI